MRSETPEEQRRLDLECFDGPIDVLILVACSLAIVAVFVWFVRAVW